MGEITEHDFGKRHREAARTFARLAGVLEARAEAFLKDPDAFFKEAGEQIVRLRLVLQNARDALRDKSLMTRSASELAGKIPYPAHLETIRVTQGEYDRLKACERIIRDFEPV